MDNKEKYSSENQKMWAEDMKKRTAEVRAEYPELPQDELNELKKEIARIHDNAKPENPVTYLREIIAEKEREIERITAEQEFKIQAAYERGFSDGRADAIKNPF